MVREWNIDLVRWQKNGKLIKQLNVNLFFPTSELGLNLVYIDIILNLVCIAIGLKNRTCTSFMEKQSKAAF